MLIGWILFMWVAAMALQAWANHELDGWQKEEFGRHELLTRTRSIDHE